MKILDPQSAILSNVEVLAHFTQNPPRRPPNPPPNANPRNFTPSPDLRDHNTVVKEFHDYVSRLSPHLLKYPSFDVPASTRSSAGGGAETKNGVNNHSTSAPLTPLDTALRDLITRLKPFQLTKAEVLTMLNLGIGLDTMSDADRQQGQVDDAAAGANDGGGGGGDGGEDTVMQDGDQEAGDIEDDDYGAMAILNTVIEDRPERLTDENVLQILAILRETLGGLKRSGDAA